MEDIIYNNSLWFDFIEIKSIPFELLKKLKIMVI